MKCMFCKGEMIRAKAPFDVEREGYHIHFNSLDAWVCTQCGEVYFESGIVSKIQNAVKNVESVFDLPQNEALNNVA